MQAILAVDAGGSVLKAALIDDRGRLIPGSDYRLPVQSNGELKAIAATYTRLAKKGKETAEKLGFFLEGIGVSIPGPFDYEKGHCLMTHKYQSIFRIPMRPWFEEGAGKIPVRFVHDSTAFILGATWNGGFDSYRRICAVIIGTGLGFASLYEGQVYKNEQGGPGISIFSRPYKGKTAEDYVSRRGIIHRYQAKKPDAYSTDGKGPDVREIAEKAREGDLLALEIFRETGRHLAAILHDIVLDEKFEVLLLGGQISKSSDLFIGELKEGLNDLPFKLLIKQAENIDNAPLIGVARACWQNKKQTSEKEG